MNATKLNDKQRLEVMSDSKAYMIEQPYYNILSDKVKDYDGGYFEMVKNDDGNPILFIDSDKEVKVEAAFDYVTTDLKTATVAIWLLNTNWASWAFAEKDSELSQHFADMYYSLRETIWADDNPLGVDQTALFKILD